MSIRFKIFLAFFLLFVVGIFQITRSFRDDVRKSYLESLEENMVDSANILAEITAGHYRNGKFDLSFLTNSMQRVAKRQPRARIYKLLKNKIDADIYITDNKGIILFNSSSSQDTPFTKIIICIIENKKNTQPRISPAIAMPFPLI